MIFKNKKIILFLVIGLGVFGISCAKTHAQSYEWFMYHDRVDGSGSQNDGGGSQNTGGTSTTTTGPTGPTGSGSPSIYEEQAKKAAEEYQKLAAELAQKAAEEAAKKAVEEAAQRAAEEAARREAEERQRQIEEAQRRAEEASDAAAEAQKELTKIENQIDMLKKEIEKAVAEIENIKAQKLEKEGKGKSALYKTEFLKGLDKKFIDIEGVLGDNRIEDTVKDILKDIEITKNELLIQLDNAEKEQLRLEAEIEKAKVDAKFEEMGDAYKALAAEYENLEETGDPVQVGTGNFIAEYIDFTAQDFRKKFKIQRNRSEAQWNGSFGKNWNCELDTRILRTMPYVDDAFYNQLLSAGEEIYITNNESIIPYNENYEDYYSDELYLGSLYIQNILSLFDAELNYLDNQREKQAQIIEKNRYAAYGKYADSDYLYSDADYLIFVAKNGREYKLFKDEDGKWRSPGKNAGEAFYVLDHNGGEYEVVFADGSRSFYDEYGILRCDWELDGSKTEYESKNGKISKIRVKTGETVTVFRDAEGKITKIEAPVSGKAEYQYQNGRLCSVTDNNGIKVEYEYDSDGYLTKITKADGRSISIGYVQNAVKKKKVCTRVTNENGQTETFSYDYENGIVKHKTVSGLQEVFHLNQNGMTVAYEDGMGNKIELEVDDTGRILQSVKQGVKRRYEYDENSKLKAVYYQDGSSESLKYNEYGKLVEYKDRDGFSKSYVYDAKGNVTQIYYCGNLITSISYRPNGLVSSICEKGITYNYEYNEFGSVTRKWWRGTDGKSYEERFEYDFLNRVINEVGVDGVKKTFSYGTKTKTTVIADIKQTDVVYNARNWPVKITQKDLKTKKTVEFRYVYDGRGKISLVYLNNEPYSMYEYNDFGKISKVSVFAEGKEPFETEYKYDSYGFIVSEASKLGDEQIEKYNVKYSRGSNSTQLKAYQGKNLVCSYDYDNLGRLTKVLQSDGYTKQISYSKGGRILEELDSNGVKTEYRYNTNGTWKVEETKNGSKRNVFEYDADGKLVKKTNTLDGNTVYEYDCFGRLTGVRNAKGLLSYSYDEKGRKTGEAVVENGIRIYEKKLEYDDKNCCRTEYEGNVIRQIEYTDAWNRVIKRISALGEYLYDYDWSGNIVKITGPDGKTQEFEYSAAGKVVKSVLENGEKQWKWGADGNLLSVMQNQTELYKAEYDELGRLVKETNLMGNEHEYGYGEDGKINLVQNYDTGKKEINVRKDGKISMLDSSGNEYLFELGKDGKVECEIDSENNKTLYKYDINGRLKEKTFGSGLVSTITYVQSENKTEIGYSNGEKLEVWKNALGQITKIQSGEVADEFEYDLGGRLVLGKNDVIQSFVKYEYDNFGRCVQKSGEDFEVLYEHDSFGRVSKVTDKFSGAEACYEYDKKGKVCAEHYSNGITVYREYNELNNPVRISSKNRAGVELWNQAIEYDEKNRVKKITQSDGKLWEYEYDSKGRLVKCVSPYSGKEAYEYTASGSVSTVISENKKTVYEYDKMNRISSVQSGFESEKSIFQWDKNGCLVCVTTPFQTINLRYGSHMRPTEVEVRNLQTGSVRFITYEYDALGRRISQSVDGVKTVYVYDGLSNNVICNTVVTAAGRVLSKEKSQKEEIEGDVKWMDTDGFSENSSGRGAARTEDFNWEEHVADRTSAIGNAAFEGENAALAGDFASTEAINMNSSTRPKRTVYHNDNPVFVVYSNSYDAVGTEVEFLVRDYKGNVAAAFDCDGNCVDQGVNDLWGNELENSRNGSYGRGVRHTEIPGFTFIDMGARDYVPALKCFTTQDSLRDGGNWFAYCACDPLNYVDKNGYFKGSYTEEEKAEYAAGVAEIGKFNKEEYLETGKSVGIRTELDCADVSSEIDRIVTKEAGLETTSKRQKQFNDDMEQGKINEAKNDVQAENFYKDKENYVRTGGKEDLSDPEIVTVGSVLVFGDNPATDLCENHTVTITAIDYDENGKVIGVSYIEGHTGGGKTETGYMDVKHLNGWGFYDGVYTIEAWKGIFEGVFEIEGSGGNGAPESEDSADSADSAGNVSLEGGCEK